MKLSKKQYILLGILCLLIITNPSISSFRAYLGSSSGASRPANLFIFSIYDDNYGDKYIGVLGNFIGMPEFRRTNVDTVSTKKVDPYAEFGGHIDAIKKK